MTDWKEQESDPIVNIKTAMKIIGKKDKLIPDTYITTLKGYKKLKKGFKEIPHKDLK